MKITIEELKQLQDIEDESVAAMEDHKTNIKAMELLHKHYADLILH